MTRKPRRLHSVPTGADVDAPSNHAPDTTASHNTASHNIASNDTAASNHTSGNHTSGNQTSGNDASGNTVAPLGRPALTPPPAPLPPALIGLDSATGPTSVPGWPFPLVDLSSLTAEDVATLMDRIGQFSQDGRFQTGQRQSPAPSRPRARRRDPVILRVRVDLDGIKPPIWRRLDLASDLTLDQLHTVLQSVFGWHDAHLHSFLRGDSRYDRAAERYLTPFDVAEGDDGVLETEVRLDELFVDRGDKLFYTYDFGDSWEHTLVLESTTARSDDDPAVRCVSGRREGPPEDCGGIWGYQELQERGELFDDPESFDLAAINDKLSLLDIDRAPAPVSTLHVAGNPVSAGFATHLPRPLADLLSRSTGPSGATLADLLTRIDFAASISLPPTAAETLARRYRWLLQRVGTTGIPLTAAGYLKPVDVSAAFTELDLGDEWIGTGNREVHSLPVLLLRESAQKLGLLRKFNGRLLQTKAGSSVASDPIALLDWIASRLPLGKSLQEKDAGLALLTVICALGPQQAAGATRSMDQLVADVLSGVGWRDHDGRPISAMMANLTADLTETVLMQLGALRWLPGSARRAVTAEGAEFARLAITR